MMPQFWCLLLTGVAGGVLLGRGEFAAAAVLAAWAIWECHRRSPAQRGLALCLIEISLLGGLVYFYRQSVRLQCLALFALLGAFIDAHLTAMLDVAPGERVAARLRLLTIAAWFATVTEWFVEGTDPVLGHPVALPIVVALSLCGIVAHGASLRKLARLAVAARRGRSRQRLTLVKPRLAV